MTHHDPLLATFDAALGNNDVPASTRRRYVRAAQSFTEWFVATNDEAFWPDRITPIDLTAYRAFVQAEQSTSSVNIHVAALKQFCAFLVEAKYRADNPALKLKTVGKQKELQPKSLTANEINALLRAAQQARNQAALKYAVAQLLLQTGLREFECSALNIADLTISERRGDLFVRKGKRNSSRTVPVNASARSALADYLGPRWGVEPNLKELALVWAEHGKEPLFIGQRGDRLGTSGIYKIIVGLVDAAQPRVPDDTSPHTLRHTFAYHYLGDNPGDLVGLAALLGHNSLEATKIYVQPRAEDLAQRVERGRLNAY